MTLDPESARMARLYQESGMSIRAVATACGRSPKTVHRRLAAAGVPLRASGGAGRRRQVVPITEQQEAQMAAAYQAGDASLETIGAAHGVSGDRVARILRARGVEIRPRGRSLAAQAGTPASAEVLRLHHDGLCPHEISGLGHGDVAEIARSLRRAGQVPHRGRRIPGGSELTAAYAAAGTVRGLAGRLHVSEVRLRAALEAAGVDFTAAQRTAAGRPAACPPVSAAAEPRSRSGSARPARAA